MIPWNPRSQARADRRSASPGELECGGDEAVRPGAGGGFLRDRLREDPVRVEARRLDLRAPAAVQPPPELLTIDLGMELDREMPAEAERLHAEGIPGEHDGLGRRHAPVVMELQPRPRRDQPGIR